MGSQQPPYISPKDKIFLKFMATMIDQMTTSIINQEAVVEILLKNGVMTKDQYKKAFEEAKKRPEIRTGKSVVRDMLTHSDMNLSKKILDDMMSEI